MIEPKVTPLPKAALDELNHFCAVLHEKGYGEREVILFSMAWMHGYRIAERLTKKGGPMPIKLGGIIPF